MFTFQSIMYVSLGFLCAVLLGFVVAPAYWARAVRLTTARIRSSLPLTEAEISAERDRLRAENAIRVHHLTSRLEQARLFEARQKVEINRRDAMIGDLERRLRRIETEREGRENARRVLEATITQRIPEIEGRLTEARQLLAKRDAEMKALQTDTGRTYRALDEAMQVNAQQRADVDRLKMTLAGQSRQLGGSESETVLRTELEKVRARSREQANLISRLQSAEAAGLAAIEARTRGAANDDDAAKALPVELHTVRDRDTQVRALEDRLAEQAAEIEALSARLETYEVEAPASSRSISFKDPKTALKSRLARVEKQLAARDRSIAELRRELASANERIARQASYYMNELRRLGSGAQSSGSSAASSSAVDRLDNAVRRDEAEAERENATRSGRPETTGRVANGAASPDEMAAHEAAAEAARSQIDTSLAAAPHLPTLEQRLAAADTSEGSTVLEPQAADGRVRDGTTEEIEDVTRQKEKLMDRIAALAKR